MPKIVLQFSWHSIVSLEDWGCFSEVAGLVLLDSLGLGLGLVSLTLACTTAVSQNI